MERRNAHRVIPSDVPYHLSGSALEAFGIDFAGNVVIPELPPRASGGLAMAAPGPVIRNPLPLSSAGTVYESQNKNKEWRTTPAVVPQNHARSSFLVADQCTNARLSL